jgi:hypothetical protein
MQLEIGECFESISDAIGSAVAALGGFKKVGAALRPELPTPQAGNWLRDCLNPARRERLDPEQVLLILRMARQAGFHAAMDFIAGDAGYKAQPLDPATQEAELQQRFVDAVAGLQLIQKQLERAAQLRRVA